MIRNQYILDLAEELAVDNFAGGGGASTGIELAIRRHVDIAINHNAAALGMHGVNHPQTHHLCEDVFAVDPIKETAGRPVGLAWFSPDCKHFSKAKGGKPLSKKIRGLAWVMLNWVVKVAPRVCMLENVEEFQTWGPVRKNGKPNEARKGWFFRCFVGALERRGYKVEYRELRACDYGAPTIRKRLFLIARRDGRPIVWPKATHAAPELARAAKLKPYRTAAECIDFGINCPSIFLSKAEAKKVRCKRPLAKASLARIAKGIGRYVVNNPDPFIVRCAHGEVDKNGKKRGRGAHSVFEPLPSVLASRDFAVAVPFIAHAQHKGAVRPATVPLHTIAASTKDQNQVVAVHLTKFNTGSVGSSLRAPVPTIVSCSHRPETRGGAATPLGLVAASLVKMRGAPETHGAGVDITDPVHTISAGGNHHGVIAAFLAQHNTGLVGHDAREPFSTISGKGAQQQVVSAAMVKYYGTDQDPRLDEPLHSVTTRHRFGVADVKGVIPPLTPEMIAKAKRVARFLRDHGIEFDGEFATVGEFVIVDIGMRMLTPRELFRAQGFPESYVIDRTADGQVLTKEAQIRMCGNSVCPPVAAALVRANLPELIIERARAA